MFRAAGGEKYVTIGQFTDDQHMHIMKGITLRGGKDNNYHIDDVKLYPVHWYRHDTMMCEGSSILLHRQNKFYKTQWPDKDDTGSTYIVTKAGRYGFLSQNDTMAQIDSYFVSYYTFGAQFASHSMNLCEGKSYTATINKLKGTSYQWSDGSTGSSMAISKAGTYWVHAQNDTCGYTDTLHVRIAKDYSNSRFLPRDTGMCDGDVILMQTDTFPGTVTWQDSSSIGKPFMISQPGIYTAMLQNACGTFKNTINIKQVSCACQLYAPNIFSPDANKLNDQLNIYSSCDLTNYHIEIYNRWGQRIYQSTDITKGWDGTFEGQDCQEGIYMLSITATAPDGKTLRKKDTLHLVRSHF